MNDADMTRIAQTTPKTDWLKMALHTLAPDDSHNVLPARIAKLEDQYGLRDKDILVLARDMDALKKDLHGTWALVAEQQQTMDILTDMVIKRNTLIADIKASQPRIRARLTKLERKRSK